MRAGETRDEHAQRVGHILQERFGQTSGRYGAERFAVQPGLIRRHVALLPAHAQADRAPFALQLPEQAVGVDPVEDAFADLGSGEVADAAQHVVQTVAAGRARELRAALQVVLHSLQGARVDQLAQLLLAEQLAQQVAVERQRRRAALGVRRVALVHVGRDVVKQQRGGKWRGCGGLDLDERDLARV